MQQKQNNQQNNIHFDAMQTIVATQFRNMERFVENWNKLYQLNAPKAILINQRDLVKNGMKKLALTLFMADYLYGIKLSDKYSSDLTRISKEYRKIRKYKTNKKLR